MRNLRRSIGRCSPLGCLTRTNGRQIDSTLSGVPASAAGKVANADHFVRGDEPAVVAPVVGRHFGVLVQERHVVAGADFLGRERFRQRRVALARFSGGFRGRVDLSRRFHVDETAEFLIWFDRMIWSGKETPGRPSTRQSRMPGARGGCRPDWRGWPCISRSNERPCLRGRRRESMAHDEPTSRPDPIAALRRRSFLIYIVGSLLSNTGNQMRATAVGWEIYHRTGEALSLGIIGLVLALPVILFALPAGTAADRYSRRGMIMLGQAGLALSAVGLAWSSHAVAPVPLVYLLLFGTGTFRALGWPAQTAIVAGLVPAKVFPNATMWRSVSWQLAATVGPLAGGLLLAVWSPMVVYLIDAASSMILLVCMMFVEPTRRQRVAQPSSWRSLMEGIRFLRRQPILISTMTLDMVAVLFGGATALLPIYASDVLQVGATGLRLDAGDAVAGGDLYGIAAGRVAADAAWRAGAVVGRGGIRRGDDCVRVFEVVPAVTGGAVRTGSGRQHQRRGALDRAAALDARLDAWPRVGRERHFHRHEQ